MDVRTKLVRVCIGIAVAGVMFAGVAAGSAPPGFWPGTIADAGFNLGDLPWWFWALFAAGAIAFAIFCGPELVIGAAPEFLPELIDISFDAAMDSAADAAATAGDAAFDDSMAAQGYSDITSSSLSGRTGIPDGPMSDALANAVKAGMEAAADAYDPAFAQAVDDQAIAGAQALSNAASAAADAAADYAAAVDDLNVARGIAAAGGAFLGGVAAGSIPSAGSGSTPGGNPPAGSPGGSGTTPGGPH